MSTLQAAVRQARHWRRTRRYRRARADYLSDHPWCAVCASHGLTVPATQLDHVVPVHVAPERFWDKANWQGLCGPCHNDKSASERTTVPAPVSAQRAAWDAVLGAPRGWR